MSTPTNNEETSTALAVPETTKAITRFTAEHAREVGLPSAEAINFMSSVANLITASALIGRDMGLSKDQFMRLKEFGLSPEDIEERDRQAVKANSMAKMLVGRELNPPLAPMTAMQEIDIVKGRIFVRYQQIIAMIEAKGYEIEEVERTHKRAAIRLHPNVKPSWGDGIRSYEFTFDDAKMAKLTDRRGYNNEPSQYELRPRVMLWSRLMSETNRAIGNTGVYERSEMEDFQDAPTERGDNSNGAFREQAQRNAEPKTSPFGLTHEAAADPLADKPSNQGAKEEVPTASAAKETPKQDTKPPAAETKAPPAETNPPAADTKAPAADTPKGRGRPKKVETAPAAPVTPVQAGPVLVKETTPANGFKASDADLPAEMGGQPAEPTPVVVDQMTRIQAIDSTLAAACKADHDTAKDRVRLFMIAFCHPEKLTKPPRPDYDELIPFAEALAKNKPSDLFEKSDALGTACKAGWEKLKRWIEAEDMHAEMKALCIRAAHECFYDDGGESLIDFFEGIVEPDGRLDEGSRIAFLKIYLSMPAKDVAMKLLEKARAQDKSLAEFLGPFDAAKVTEQQVLTMIAGGAQQQDPLWQE